MKTAKEVATVNFEIKNLVHPWIVLVRICAVSIKQPSKIKNVRIKKIDQETILITWNDKEHTNYKRCIQTYEIYYSSNIDDEENGQWQLITQNDHVPFLSYCYHISEPNKRLQGIIVVINWCKFINFVHFHFYYLLGYYKIRAMDIFGRFGEFSNIFKYQRVNSNQSNA